MLFFKVNNQQPTTFSLNKQKSSSSHSSNPSTSNSNNSLHKTKDNGTVGEQHVLRPAIKHSSSNYYQEQEEKRKIMNGGFGGQTMEKVCHYFIVLLMKCFFSFVNYLLTRSHSLLILVLSEILVYKSQFIYKVFT